jgi:hypothetical protein
MGLKIASLAGVGIVGVSAPAHAAPWTQDPGNIYARASIAAETLETTNAISVDATRYDVYAEYGLADRWTITAKAESIAYENDLSDFNREAYRATVRHLLWQNESGWKISAEAGAVYGATSAGIFGCDTLGGEARLSAGKSGALKDRDYYLFGDIAIIGYEDGCRRERAEFGYGSQVLGRVHLGQQVWLEQGNQSATSVKVETMLSYQFDRFDLSAGYRDEIGGEFEEDAYVIAITVRR